MSQICLEKYNHLTDGATMIPTKISLVTTKGCVGGISNMCFKKKVLSSQTCQKITSWQIAKKRM